MDQNLVRTDLLPMVMPTVVLVGLAIAAIGAWIAAHSLVKRYLAKLKAPYRVLLVLPFGVIAAWLTLQATSRFLFLATDWSLFFSAIIAAAALESVAVIYEHEKERVAKKAGRAIVILRLASLAILFFMIMQPVHVGESRRTVRSRVVVLVDDSASMHFTDRQWTDEEREDVAAALGKTSAELTDLTRAEIVRALLNRGGNESALKRISKTCTVDVFRFGHGARADGTLLDGEGDATGRADDATVRVRQFRSATDMTRALETVMREIPTEEIASVIFFTDGRHTGDAGVESVSRKLGSMGVTVSSVVVGGTTPPFDLAIASVQAPDSVFVGDKVRFVVNVSATMARGKSAEVTLMVGEKVLETKTLEIGTDDWQEEVRFKHEPEKSGILKYSVRLKTLEGELFEENNRWDVSVSASDDRTNVLLVDNRPRWEFRYLRNLFYGRDKSVHLQDYLMTPDTCPLPPGLSLDPLPPASAGREFGDSESGDFPQESEEWRKFDIIIIGDLDDSQLTAETVRMIKYCVEERGALLVVIAGPESMPYRVTNPDFRAMLPIEFTPDGQDHRTPPEDEYTFSLTPAGRGHPVMAQSSSSAENEEIWGELPDFHWRIPIDGVKAGAEVLAWAQSKKDAEAGAKAIAQSIAATIEEDPEAAVRRLEEMRGEQFRNALVVARVCGRGKVLMMNTDRMWRLRYRVGDTRHHRFWGQVVRWGAGEKLQKGNEYVRLGTDQLRYDVGETVKVYAKFLDYNYGGLQNLEPRVVLSRGAKGKTREYPLRLRPDSNGFYECEIPGIEEPGSYQVELECEDAIKAIGHNFPRHLKTPFVVVVAKQPVESVNITASRDAPTRMAKATGGKVMTPSEWIAAADGAADGFGADEKTMRDRTEYQLWCMPPLFVLLAGLLTAEWIIRKRAKLA